jgi:TetR/AcrR family transcriptional regulator, lmrAB and yxaGH operons repressor
MPAALSKDEVVDRLSTVFRAQGYDGASLAELGRAAGLGRSSLYHHFPGGKADMAGAVLDHIQRWVQTEVLAPLQGPGEPAERLHRMVEALDRFYAGGRNRCLLGGFVLGGARQLFQRRLAAAFSAWIEALATLLEEAGIERAAARERAEDAVLQIQGALVLAGGLDDPGPFQRVLKRLPEQMLVR